MYYILLAIGITTHILRTIYNHLKVKKKINTENKLIFAGMFANMTLLWISWFNMCHYDPYKLTFHKAIHYGGFMIFICGVLLALIALVQIRAFENYNGELVQTGVYKYFRHPMYVGFFCWIFGYAIFTGALISFLIGMVFSMNITTWKITEESLLKEQFPEYEAYMKKTVF